MSEAFSVCVLAENWRGRHAGVLVAPRNTFGASETKLLFGRLLLSRARLCFTWQIEPTISKFTNQSSDIGEIPLKNSIGIRRATYFREEPPSSAARAWLLCFLCLFVASPRCPGD